LRPVACALVPVAHKDGAAICTYIRDTCRAIVYSDP
jgi:hypothetical protein